MIDAAFHVDGLKELQAALAELPKTAQGAALADAVRAGGNVIRDEARQRAPKHAGPYEGKKKSQQRPGTLKRGIVTRMKRNLAEGWATASITVSKKAWYGRLVEMGHRIVGRLPKGAKGGVRKRARLAQHALGRHVPPHPFLRPAIDVKAQEAVNALRDALVPAIVKQWAKLARKARSR